MPLEDGQDWRRIGFDHSTGACGMVHDRQPGREYNSAQIWHARETPGYRAPEPED